MRTWAWRNAPRSRLSIDLPLRALNFALSRNTTHVDAFLPGYRLPATLPTSATAFKVTVFMACRALYLLAD